MSPVTHIVVAVILWLEGDEEGMKLLTVLVSGHLEVLHQEHHHRLTAVTFASVAQPQAKEKVSKKFKISFFEYWLQSKGAGGFGWFVTQSSFPIWWLAGHGQIRCHLCLIPPHFNNNNCLLIC